MLMNERLIDLSIPPGSLSARDMSVWRTLVYADLFDYPLTMSEIHRYLEERQASFEQIGAALASGSPLRHHVSRRGEYYMLSGREHLVDIRSERAQYARQLWPTAVHYGRLMARLPFMRMVAVTGSLAMANVEIGADLDYLLVTRNDRLWVCRAFVILLVHLARRRGYVLCPNYILSERALEFPDRNLYTARELTQMIPLWGMETYRRMRRANKWTNQYLPNAVGPPSGLAESEMRRHPLWRLLEFPLRTPAGSWLERWEMRRKIKKFQAQGDDEGEAAFSADWCKGHFDAHLRLTLTAYAARLQDSL